MVKMWLVVRKKKKKISVNEIPVFVLWSNLLLLPGKTAFQLLKYIKMITDFKGKEPNAFQKLK